MIVPDWTIFVFWLRCFINSFLVNLSNFREVKASFHWNIKIWNFKIKNYTPPSPVCLTDWQWHPLLTLDPQTDPGTLQQKEGLLCPQQLDPRVGPRVVTHVLQFATPGVGNLGKTAGGVPQHLRELKYKKNIKLKKRFVCKTCYLQKMAHNEVN